MCRQHEKWKRKRKKKKFNYANRIDTLLYSTFKRIPVVFYHANLYRNGYASKDNYSCLLDNPFAIHAFEDMRTWLTFFGGCSISFFVIHAAPHFLSVVFGDMSSIAFSTPGDMRVTAKC